MKKICTFFLIIIMVITMISLPLALTGCNKRKQDNETTQEATANPMDTAKEIEISIDENDVHQTIEGFGASGAWWSQKAGGWTKIQKNGLETREYIAKLLFDREEGIGLNTYRYNIGAGSADSGNGDISDSWRRAESFETEAGVYDFSKDKNAVWFVKRATELGVTDIVMFANSPLERLTITGNAHGQTGCSPDGKTTSNLAPENYGEYAEYFLDVAEHFIDEGYPIKFISPINEPQWEWVSGQEGCHYEPEEVVAFLKVFIEKKEEREKLKDVEITVPESGEWGNTNYKYMEAILKDEYLSEYFSSIDNHSYWSDKNAKATFKSWLNKQGFENLKLRTSEWCEMVNGIDYTMDSAINLAKEINDDLTVLDVVSWQYWIAVSCYNYRDGLIYVSKSGENITVPKRLWAMGNFSKFVRPGYKRVAANTTASSVDVSAFKGNNGTNDEMILVIINSGVAGRKYDISSLAGSSQVKVYTTDKTFNLEDTTDERYSDGNIYLSPQSVTTIVVSK